MVGTWVVRRLYPSPPPLDDMRLAAHEKWEAGNQLAALYVNFIPEEIHVLAVRLATYVPSDSTTAKVTNQ